MSKWKLSRIVLLVSLLCIIGFTGKIDINNLFYTVHPNYLELYFSSVILTLSLLFLVPIVATVREGEYYGEWE